MKRFALFSLISMCLLINLIAQNTDKKQNLPKENSKVTKEYDEQGNLIKFDSLYTYSWSGGDTTMFKSFSPKDLPGMFGNNFGFFPDSAFRGHSFFDEFDRLFAEPNFGGRDSLFLKQFDQFHDFGNFIFEGDSITPNNYNLEDFLGRMTPDKNDSISSQPPRMPFGTSPRTMEDMMKMMQQHMMEMDEMQRKFFEEHQNSKNQSKLKEF